MDESLTGTAELYREGVNSCCIVQYSITYTTTIETESRSFPPVALAKGIVNYVKTLETALVLPHATYRLLRGDEIIRLKLMGSRWFVLGDI